MRQESFPALPGAHSLLPAAQIRSAVRLAIIAALFALSLASLPAPASAGLFISVGIAPPPLPVYDQPPIPGDGYMWTPGYWAWDDAAQDYYWVPGVWVLAPEPGYLWTPGYWGYSDGVYVWNAGYWGTTVGFYGGVCYGFGYTGVGFYGGYWTEGHYYYNRSVTNISNTTVITNVYNKTVINNNVTNVSYNGGQGGIKTTPTPQERLAASQHHLPPNSLQTQHQELASHDHSLFSKVNNGKPSIAAVTKPGNFSGPGVFAAKAAGPVHPAAFGNAGMGDKLIKNGNGPRDPHFKASQGLQGQALGKGPDQHNPSVNSYQRNPGFNNYQHNPSINSYQRNPGFNNYQKATGLNPGRPSFNRGPSGRPQFNAATGKHPPMHYPQGQPHVVKQPVQKDNKHP
jgi:WXXGXW repeat (2 copies)